MPGGFRASPIERLQKSMKRLPAIPPRTHAFTLIELLAVLAVLVLCAVMLLPAFARTQPDSRAFQCLNNLRELNRAWRMWSDDNQDLLLYASELNSTVPSAPRVWVRGHVD